MKLATYERVCRDAAILFMFLGVALWIYYFAELYDLFVYDLQYTIEEIFKGWYAQILQFVAEITGIILLIVFKKKGLPVILGVCALVIALECGIDAYLLLVEYQQIFDKDPADFFQGALSLVIGAMLFFNAILYSIRATKSAALIKYASIILILLQIFGVIVELRGGVSFSMILTEREYDFPSYLLLFLVLMMSVSKFTNQTSLMGIVKLSIRDLRNSMMTEGVGIDRDIAVRFSDYNNSGLWCDTYSFILPTFNMGLYSMSLTSAGGHMVGTITSVENDTGMNVFTFNITGVWFDNGDPTTCDLMRFYGNDGLFIQFIVRNASVYKPRGVPKFGAANLSSREEGTTTHNIRVKISVFMGFVKKHLHKFKAFLKTNTVDRIRNLRKKEE